MTTHNIPENALIVVADGTGALLYRNRANAGANLKLEKTGVLEPRNLDYEGPAGRRPPESSKKETNEATFAKQLANHLYTLAEHGAYDALVLVADPETLGQMRPSLHKVVTDRLVQEVTKTLTNSPVSDIERSLNS